MKLKDQLGYTHHFTQTPKRVISLVPSITETLYELGLEDRIVGITKFCVHPFHFKTTKKNIGGTKNIHIEKVRALQPDIIIANKEENTEEVVRKLQEFCRVWVTDVENFEDTIQMINDFGAIFKRKIDAQKWVDKLFFAKTNFEFYMKNVPQRKVAYLIWREPFMAAGGSTFIDYLLKINHFENIYRTRKERYPEIEIRKIRIQGDPEIVFLPSEPYPFKEEHAFEIGRSTHHAKTIFVDGEMFSWFGTHLFKAFEYFKLLQERLKE